MIRTITIKWAVSQPMVRGSHIGQFATREEAQAVADAQSVPHRVTKWTIHEYKNSTGCGPCDEEAHKGYRSPKGSALCVDHNKVRLETL